LFRSERKIPGTKSVLNWILMLETFPYIINHNETRGNLMESAIRSIEIIVDKGNNGWILEKIALRICSEFRELGKEAYVRNSPEFDTSVTFWVQFTDKTIKTSSKSGIKNLQSVLVTHVDDAQKLRRIKHLDSIGIDLIFLSAMHALEIANATGVGSFPTSIRLGSDLAIRHEKFSIGIVSKCYPDRRKNENWLLSFEKKGLLTDVAITIIGSGWSSITEKLKQKGVEVNLFDGVSKPYPSYEEIIQIQKTFDLFFYFGFDEGSLGALDAYLLNVDLLLTNQGFHSDFKIDENSYCENLIDAQNKFLLKKQKYFSQFEHKGDWSWKNTASNLLSHWETLSIESDTMSFIVSQSRLNKVYLRNFLKLIPKTIFRIAFVRIPRKIRSKFLK